MPFLVVNNVTVLVSTGGATKKSVERIGSAERAFAGNLRSTVRAEKRGWTFTTRWMSNTDANTLEAAVVNAAFVTCSGDVLGGNVTCEVTVGDSPHLATSTSFRRQVQLTLREV